MSLAGSWGRAGQVKCTVASWPLAAAVLVREALLPGAVGQRQQQEEDPAHDEDGPRTADARHRPGELVVEGNRVVAGQERQDGLVEDHEGQEHQDTCGGQKSSMPFTPTGGFWGSEDEGKVLVPFNEVHMNCNLTYPLRQQPGETFSLVLMRIKPISALQPMTNTHGWSLWTPQSVCFAVNVNHSSKRGVRTETLRRCQLHPELCTDPEDRQDHTHDGHEERQFDLIYGVSASLNPTLHCWSTPAHPRLFKDRKTVILE